MASNMLSFVLVFAIAIAVIYIALNTGKPAVDLSKASSDLVEAEMTVRILGNYIDETASEAEGSVRRQTFSAPGKIEILAGEDAIVYRNDESYKLFEYGMRAKEGNIIYITGSDVSCEEKDGNNDGTDDIVVENSLVKFVFNSTGSPGNFSAIDTGHAILLMEQKAMGAIVVPENSPVYINGNISTGSGSGYSELLSRGGNLPFCSAHFFVDSGGASYDVVYRLYAGADFIVASVRNINYG